MSNREKIVQKITITYYPRRDDYGIYDIKPDATYEMAALDKSLLRSGELTIGDWDEDEVVSEWEIVEVEDGNVIPDPHPPIKRYLQSGGENGSEDAGRTT